MTPMAESPRSAPPRSRATTVTAIVPAYNEAETLEAALEVLQSAADLDSIVVVSDGSTDSTVEIARAAGVTVLDLTPNRGKARAMAEGVAATDAEILLFVDGDILDLTRDMIHQLIEPVTSGRAAMNVGVRHRGELLNAVQCRFGPLLSGIRALRREVFEAVPEPYLEGYRIETALNYVCRRLGLAVETVVLHDLRHTVKEKKRGVAAGTQQRLAMFASVFAAFVQLRWEQPLVALPAPSAPSAPRPAAPATPAAAPAPAPLEPTP